MLTTRDIRTRFSRDRGTVLVVALIFAVVIAISLSSFLRLALSATKLSDRSFYVNAARNLVDLGLERAMWCLNNEQWTLATGFQPRGSHPGEYQGTFPSSSTYYSFAAGVKGQVKVWIDTTHVVDGVRTPHAVALATVLLGAEPLALKEAEIYISLRSIAEQPLVARSGLVLNGNIYADSWNSFSDTPSTADDAPYSSAVRHAELRVAAAYIAMGNLTQVASIYGYAMVDASNPTGILLGDGGRLVGGFAAGPAIDPNRVTRDLTTNFPDVAPPTTSSYVITAITTATELPRPGDSPAADGIYYYRTPAIALAGSDSLGIGPAVVDATHLPVKVAITLTNTIGNTAQTTDDAAINVGPESTLSIYTSGNVAIGGKGLVNGPLVPNNPDNLQLYGTRTAADAVASGLQVMTIKGVPYLSAVVYAPNSQLTVGCESDTYGAIIGDRITLVGDGRFHGDESLKRKSALGIWGPSKWRELSLPTERSAYTDQLTF